MLHHSRCYVLIRLFFNGLFYSRDLHKKEETMVFEAHGMLFPCRLQNTYYSTMPR